MRETMVLLPWWPFSAEVSSSAPFYKGMLEVLRQRFEVSIADHPWVRGKGPPAPPPRTLDDVAASFAGHVTGNAHLVATGGSGVFAMLATSRQPPQVKSFVFDSFPVPPATLSALGMSGLADMAAVALRVEPAGLRELIPLAMPGSDPTETASLVARIRPTIDWDHCSAAFQLVQEVNLLELPIALPPRTLFLDNPIAYPGLLDLPIARKLFPKVQVEIRGASDLMDSDKGVRLAEQITDYVTGRR